MAIQILDNSVFVLETENTSYALRLQKDGMPSHLYWDRRVRRAEDFRYTEAVGEEYASFGCMNLMTTPLKVAFSDRTRDFRVGECSYSVEDDHLTVVLHDAAFGFEVRLCYRVREKYDIIERWVELCNLTEDCVRVERAFSASVPLPGDGYSVLNYAGQWGNEAQPVSEPVKNGRVVFESLAGTTGLGNNPFFAAYRSADEDHGEVYFGTLSYLGNFKVTAEALADRHLNVMLGMNDTDFTYHLQKGETLVTPKVFLGYTEDGFGDMTRILTEFALGDVMPRAFAREPLPVLYNSWYATRFRCEVGEQKKLAEKAAKIGCELFVIDDGWFGARDHDAAGLGDWTPNPSKFPNGLGELADHCAELGMRFGVWVEPEMVNPDSDLYRAHPDWVFRYDSRPILTHRNQYVLNLTMPEVERLITEMFDQLLTDSGITFVKWDHNRSLCETLSASGDDGRVWREFADAVERIIGAARERHPTVQFEACSAGGGRVSWGALPYFDSFWPSDNVNGADRLLIQEGFSMIYPIKTMRAWVTDSARGPLPFLCHSAMCGALGIGCDLNKASEETCKILTDAITQYKRIRNTVQFGRLYRLSSFRNGEFHAVQYADGDGAVLFAFRPHMRFFQGGETFRLKGLEEDALYRVKLPDGGESVFSGAYLMGHGIFVRLRGDYASAVIEMQKIKD